MALTPADVEQKTFSTALRGYDLDEVDDFLDEVVATIRDLQDQVSAAEMAAPVAAEAAAAAAHHESDESAVGRVLITAQNTADQLIADAQKEADRILAEAKVEAESWAEERERRKTEADEEIAELAHYVAGVRTQLAVLATAVADRLDEMDSALGSGTQDDDASGFDDASDEQEPDEAVLLVDDEEDGDVESSDDGGDGDGDSDDDVEGSAGSSNEHVDTGSIDEEYGDTEDELD